MLSSNKYENFFNMVQKGLSKMKLFMEHGGVDRTFIDYQQHQLNFFMKYENLMFLKLNPRP